MAVGSVDACMDPYLKDTWAYLCERPVLMLPAGSSVSRACVRGFHASVALTISFLPSSLLASGDGSWFTQMRLSGSRLSRLLNLSAKSSTSKLCFFLKVHFFSRSSVQASVVPGLPLNDHILHSFGRFTRALPSVSYSLLSNLFLTLLPLKHAV